MACPPSTCAPTRAGDHEGPRAATRAAAFVASGAAQRAFRPVVDRLFPLEEIVRAHQHMESNTQFGKIVVTAAR
ncbi:zinc-binding dehydrogenase [Nonomuraea dietziae]|uniref:zinc-binding dehydrogenase n=1 Tax=Nonomuraea dietziae TaxID=65515 RepID=UPI0031D9CADF